MLIVGRKERPNIISDVVLFIVSKNNHRILLSQPVLKENYVRVQSDLAMCVVYSCYSLYLQ
jgi:hypothetical protein